MGRREGIEEECSSYGQTNLMLQNRIEHEYSNTGQIRHYIRIEEIQED